MLRRIRNALIVLLALAAVAFTAGWWVVFRLEPSRDDEGAFSRENIMNILSGETRVFHRDGKTLLGAFFDVNHRVFVPYDSIPEPLVNALVAAEDSRYFEHGGFDWRGFTRAMTANLMAGKLKQGGSTLTQQAAKNIFGREARGVSDKYRELQHALKLEKNFTKQEILEFYLNQFYVSGTGRGVAIAAQHFFDKPLAKLSLAECAFIAGSVKGPANYDPFVQKTAEKRAKALERGKHRLAYVLRRMLEEGYIDQEEHDAALAKPLDFRMGKFRFSMSTPLERIEEILNGEFYRHLFDSLGIESWQKAQLEITSTLDAAYQTAAMHAVQTNLAELQMKLGGFALPNVDRADRVVEPRIGDYLHGQVDSVLIEKEQLVGIGLRFGQVKGIVTKAELDTLARRVGMPAIKVLGDKLRIGTVLLVRVLGKVDSAGSYGQAFPCRIETVPELQGALVAVQKGQVLASQAGFHNTGFDRNFKAVRQFGSSWKPLLYGLALRHGWTYMDQLDNEFNVFAHGTNYYFPRPDHSDKGERVTLAWAAVLSENIASIWLLEHLFDKLDAEPLAAVAMRHGYLPMANEDSKQFHVRLRDSLGLIMNNTAKQEIEFVLARNRLVTDLVLEGQPEKAWVLQQMFYGANLEKLDKRKLPADLHLRVEHNYVAHSATLRARLAAEAIGDSALPSADSIMIYGPLSISDLKRLASMVQPVDNSSDYLELAKIMYWPDWRRSLAMTEFAAFAHELGIKTPLRNGMAMPLGTNDVTLAELSTAYQTLLGGQSYKCTDGTWNEPCFILEIKDKQGTVLFRNQVEAKQVLQPTQSVQLAAMLRAVFAYGTARSALDKVLVQSEVPSSITLRVPVMGKTGTTNEYRNVAFLGALPQVDSVSRQYILNGVMAIGSYVGYDDNRSLRSGRIRVAGSSGGLPQWASFAAQVVDSRQDAEYLDFLDLGQLSSGEAYLQLPGAQAEIAVHPRTGIPDTSQNARLPWIQNSESNQANHESSP